MSVLTAFGQQPLIRFEYGSLEELRGVTKIYVYTGLELEVRNNIVKTIQSKLKHIAVTDRPEDAEVLLVFAADVNTFYAGSWSNTTTAQGMYSGQSTTTTSSIPIYHTVITGRGFVARLVGNDTIRLLLEFEDSRSTIFERRPSTNFARAFVKAYEKANKEAKKK